MEGREKGNPRTDRKRRMIDPVTYLVRLLSVRKHRSKVPTMILPLDKIKKAVVFLDYLDGDVDMMEITVRKYFETRNIEVKTINAKKWDIDIFGRYKFKKEYDNWGEDLFISLAVYNNFAAEYAAIRSRARFKIGREQVKGQVFDFVLTNPSGSIIRQPEAFEAITEFLDKVE